MAESVFPDLAERLSDVAGSIDALTLSHPTRVGIDGFCAAGKTTVARGLEAILVRMGRSVIRASTDDFQQPPPVRWQLGPDSPEGFYRHAVDFESLRKELLRPLGAGGTLRYRTATYDIHTLVPVHAERRSASPSAILLLDGLFLHDPSLRGALDFTVFVEASFETCIRRARARNQERREDAEEVETLYRRRYVPGFERYLDEVDPKARASVTILND